MRKEQFIREKRRKTMQLLFFVLKNHAMYQHTCETSPHFGVGTTEMDHGQVKQEQKSKGEFVCAA
jgi:hypothetical protein